MPAPERAKLVAAVFGIRDPALPSGVTPDPVMPGLPDHVLDAVNDFCDPRRLGGDRAPSDVQRLNAARQAVVVRLSSAMTGLSMLRVGELQTQFGTAQTILRGLAEYVHAPCLTERLADFAE